MVEISLGLGKKELMAAEAPGAGSVVVGVDGSAASAAAVRWAAREAQAHGIQLHVVHVRDPEIFALAQYAPLTSDGHTDIGPDAEKAALKAMVEEVTGPDQSAAMQLEVVDGLPARILLERAAGAEMLVLGSGRPPGRQAGRPRAPLGPVARTCVRAALCPVVIVRPAPSGQKPDLERRGNPSVAQL